MQNLDSNLISLLKDFINENDIQIDSEIDSNLRLLGSNSVFDSMELVQFIVEVEQFLDEEYGLEIELTSDKAMSRRTSPFSRVQNLIDYVQEQLNSDNDE